MMWTKSEEELRHFRNLTNQKHQSIKFGFKFSKYKIEFFDTQIYKDKNNRPQLQTRLLKKKQQLIAKTICKQNPHIRILLKKSLLYEQTLKIKAICSKIEEYK